MTNFMSVFGKAAKVRGILAPSGPKVLPGALREESDGDVFLALAVSRATRVIYGKNPGFPVAREVMRGALERWALAIVKSFVPLRVTDADGTVREAPPKALTNKLQAACRALLAPYLSANDCAAVAAESPEDARVGAWTLVTEAIGQCEAGHRAAVQSVLEGVALESQARALEVYGRRIAAQMARENPDIRAPAVATQADCDSETRARVQFVTSHLATGPEATETETPEAGPEAGPEARPEAGPEARA